MKKHEYKQASVLLNNMNYDANYLNNECLNASKRLKYTKLFKAITFLIAFQNNISVYVYIVDLDIRGNKTCL